MVPVDYDGKRWLVAPYGAVAWVHNARAAGHVSLQYGRTTREYATREVSADEAGPVLKRYVAIATKVRAQFKATEDSPVADFVAEAGAMLETCGSGSGAGRAGGRTFPVIE